MLFLILEVALASALLLILHPPVGYLTTVIVIGIGLPIGEIIVVSIVLKRDRQREVKLASTVGMISVALSVISVVFLLILGSVFLGLFG